MYTYKLIIVNAFTSEVLFTESQESKSGGETHQWRIWQFSSGQAVKWCQKKGIT